MPSGGSIPRTRPQNMKFKKWLKIGKGAVLLVKIFTKGAAQRTLDKVGLAVDLGERFADHLRETKDEKRKK